MNPEKFLEKYGTSSLTLNQLLDLAVKEVDERYPANPGLYEQIVAVGHELVEVKSAVIAHINQRAFEASPTLELVTEIGDVFIAISRLASLIPCTPREAIIMAYEKNLKKPRMEAE
jgi:hypothetical protein